MRAASRLRRDRDNRRMRPIGGGDRGDEIGDARSVLGDADAVAPGHARIAVGHMGGALLVNRRNESDAGGRKQIQRIHIGRADDAEDLGDALRDQRLDKGFAGGHARHRVSSLKIGLVGRSRACFTAGALSIARRRAPAPPPTRQWRLLSNGSGEVNLSCTDYKNALRAKKAWAEEETNE